MTEKVYKDYTEEELKRQFRIRGFILKDFEKCGRKKTATIVCKEGHEITEKMSAALRRKTCYRCTSLSYRDNLDKRLAANDFVILNYTPDINSTSTVEVMCSKGHIRKGKLSLYIHKTGCPVCKGKEAIPEEVSSKLVRLGYELISDFTYINKPHVLKHTFCGREFDVNTLVNFYHERASCPHCSYKIRMGEEDVKSALKDNNWKLISWIEPNLYTRSMCELECLDCGYSRRGILGNYIYKDIQCPSCNDRVVEKIQSDYPCVLYYLKVVYEGACYYKIGITANDTKTRFYRDLRRDDLSIEELSTLQCDTRLKAKTIEQHFLTTYSKCRYKGSLILLSGGDTELFTEDVLELDT